MRSLTLPPYLNRGTRPGGALRRLGLPAAVAAVAAGALTAAALATPAGADAASTLAAGAGVLSIRGGGEGHGVGMSQYGAEGYALHGASYRVILGHYFQGTAIGETDPDRVVRVLIADGRASFRGASAAGRVRLSPADTYDVTDAGGGLALSDTSTGRTLSALSSTLTVTGRGALRTAGGAYRGALRFSADSGGGIQTVDAVGLDDYVRGVVADEMPSSWSPAALQAQAVASRTYAITATVAGRGYDLYGDTRSEAYGGVGAQTAATDAAVAATAGRVVTYAGRPAATYFFASSGGHTESIQNVWPGAAPQPWLRGVPDPYDGAAGDPYHRWSVRLSLAAATARLGSLVRGTLQRIDVTRRGVSPRIVQARVAGTRGTTTVTGAQLQQAFGLDSTAATFTTR